MDCMLGAPLGISYKVPVAYSAVRPGCPIRPIVAVVQCSIHKFSLAEKNKIPHLFTKLTFVVERMRSTVHAASVHIL